MTTSRSPLSSLKRQADHIAMLLKAAERRELAPPGTPGFEKIFEARDRPTVKFAVIMDDKVLPIEMAWTSIIETSEAGISEFVLKQMKGSRDDATH